MLVVDGVEMVDVHEAARLVSRSQETIRRWVWTGKVHAIKRGNKLLIPRADIAPSATAAPRGQLSLAQWAAEVSARASRQPSAPGSTAADLIFADRDERSAGAGS